VNEPGSIAGVLLARRAVRKPTEASPTGLDSTGLDSTGLDSTGLDSTGLDSSGASAVVRAPQYPHEQVRSDRATTLDEGSVVGYLVGRGLLPDDSGAPVPRVPVPKVIGLGGGVSSVVLLVEAGDTRVVVKQPRRRLLVKEEWLANPMRALTEARALTLVHETTPEAVPPLLDVDASAHAITMAAAPLTWQPWKDLLLDGVADPAVARRLGLLLGAWHFSTSQHRDELAELEDLEVFDQLRIDPYHRTVAARHPALARQVATAAASLLASPARRCLVHGDFSPKNVLLGEEGLWVIDFEVAHVGNPVFDLAFLTTHLVLKSLHRPGDSELYRACAADFLDSYREVAGPGLVPSNKSLGLQVGCLLLARVDGKSPAEYLTPEEQIAARELGARLVLEPEQPLSAWPSTARPAATL
jgi:tRNA A-37 threonylcarbamoyl transferase component Bud32